MKKKTNTLHKKSNVEISYSTEDDFLIIQDFSVKQSARRKKVGTNFINQFLLAQKKKGTKHAEVGSTISIATINFWLQLGFKFHDSYSNLEKQTYSNFLKEKRDAHEVVDIDDNSVVIMEKKL